MASNDLPETRAADADTRAGGGPPATPAAVPAVIASFRVIRVIGAGGMGVVYEAEQTLPRRTVALKVIRPGVVTADLRRRFENEVQILGRLQHPGIAQVFQAGLTDLGGGPQPFFAMELVSGLPLLGFARERRLGNRERLRLIADICDAVQHAHQRGIIHRDLKPANILVEARSGQPKILDFGVARATDSDLQMTSQTLMGQIVGTLPYMSPEQLAADPAALDTRSDVYALGVILFELLTGRLPHDVDRRSTLDVMSAIRHSEPTRVSTFDRRLRGDVETIVAKALEKDKDRRYGSPVELAADIRRHLDDQPIVARPPSAAYQLRKFARRNKALVGGIAATFVILVLGVVASTWQAVRATRAERLASTRLVEADEARAVAQDREREATDAQSVADERRVEAETNFRLAEEARVRAERQRQANRELLYVADMNLALRSWNEGDYPRVMELLSRHRPGQEADLRGFEWLHLWHVTHLAERSFDDPTFVQAIDVTADGARIVAGAADGRVRVWEATGGRVALTVKTPEAVSAVAFSPDGRTLAVGSRTGRVRLMDATTGRELSVMTLSAGRVTSLHFTSAGRRLVASGTDNRTKVWEVGTLQELFDQPGAALPVSGTGDASLVLVRGPTDLRLWAPTSETPLAVDDRVRNAAVSDDGTRIAAVSASGLVSIWDQAGTLAASFRLDRPIGGGPMVLSPDGRLLAVPGPSAYAIWDVTTPRLVATVPVPARLSRLSFSPDGALLALSGEGGVALIDVATGAQRATLRGHAGVANVVMSPDGRHVVTSSMDSVKVWNLARVSSVEAFDGHRTQPEFIAISPDGRALASASVGTTAGAPTPRSKVMLWDLATGNEARSHEIPRRVSAMAMVGSRAVILGDDAGTVTFWDTTRGGEPLVVSAHRELVRHVAVSLDGTRAASSSGNQVMLWDTADAAITGTLEHRNVRVAAFAPDGRRLATAGFADQLRIWTLRGQPAARVLSGLTQGVWTLSWSPDGALIATGDETGEVQIWDLASGRVVTRLRAHPTRATAVAFSPDGRRLLTGGWDGVLRLWDVRTWNEVAHFKERTSVINAAAFALGGHAIVAASDRPSILVWRAADRAAVAAGSGR